MTIELEHHRTHRPWTASLALRLLGDLPDEELPCVAGGAALPSCERERLLEAAMGDPPLRRQIIDAWRRYAHQVVTATQMIHLVAADAVEGNQALLEHFDSEDVLLALITEDEDGWYLAEEFVAQVAPASLRLQLQESLHRWSEKERPARAASDSRLRVVIFGGHPRDESRLAPLFADGAFDLRWRTWEPRAGTTPDRRMVSAALASADAAVIVTGMTSHNIMEMVRRHAKKNAIAWKCIDKATDAQLSAALEELNSEWRSRWDTTKVAVRKEVPD